MLGRVSLAIDLDDPGPGEPTAPPQQIYAVVRQPSLLAGVGVVGDHEVTPGQCRLDVDLGSRGGLAGTMHRLAGTQQRLGGNARPVGALASDQFALDERDAQVALGQRAGAVLSG